MFLDKLIKKKKVKTEKVYAPLCVNSVNELNKITEEEYNLYEGKTLIRVDNDIYIYENGVFKVLKEPLSNLLRANAEINLDGIITEYVDSLRRVALEGSLSCERGFNLRGYNYKEKYVHQYGIERFKERLNSDGSSFDIIVGEEYTRTIHNGFYCVGEEKYQEIVIIW